jgi:hypothetical protein
MVMAIDNRAFDIACVFCARIIAYYQFYFRDTLLAV